jgi:hypothetical protein
MTPYSLASSVGNFNNLDNAVIEACVNLCRIAKRWHGIPVNTETGFGNFVNEDSTTIVHVLTKLRV